MPPADADYAQLLAAARAGSGEALGRALDACRPYLRQVARRQLDPELAAKGDASDLIQETFLEAQRDFGQFRGTTEQELLAWLSRLLLNNLVHFTRRYKETAMRSVRCEVPLAADSSDDPDGGLASPGSSPSQQAVRHEQADKLERALARLPEDYRQVIQLRQGEGRSFPEVGERMGRSAEAARKLWVRAMLRLRQECGNS